MGGQLFLHGAPVRQSVWGTSVARLLARCTGRGARFRAKMEQLKRVKGLLPESQGQNQALTVLYALHSLTSFTRLRSRCTGRSPLSDSDIAGVFLIA